MANPQKEDGYTAIANEIMEALARYRIPGEQRQCLDFILRKTYGYNKKSDAISGSQFVGATGIKKQNVQRALRGLIEKNIVIKKDYQPHPIYRFNKNYNTWKVSSKRSTVIKKDYNGNQKGLQSSSKKRPTKDTTKTYLKQYSEESESFVLSKHLFEIILKRNPKNKKPDLQKWAYNIDLLMRKNKRTFEEIYSVIEWCQESDFWQNNILSTKSLKEKFDQLYMKMKSEISGTSKVKPSTYAQAQDAERRQRAKWLLEEMKSDRQESSPNGADEDVPQLPVD